MTVFAEGVDSAGVLESQHEPPEQQFGLPVETLEGAVVETVESQQPALPSQQDVFSPQQDGLVDVMLAFAVSQHEPPEQQEPFEVAFSVLKQQLPDASKFPFS